MVLTAIRGAVGFLTQVPIGRSERAWDALGATPVVMVPAGYLIGAVVALPLLLLPAVTAAIAFPLALLAVTGIAHVDGLADAADAAVSHGSRADRREIMRDTVVGVGGTVAVALDVLGLALAGVALAGFPALVAVGLVIAAEVGAKLAMVGLAVIGRPTHTGLGSRLVGAPRWQLVAGALFAAPAALLAWPAVAPWIAILGALAGGGAVFGWARSRLGGVSGDVFGATNEVARLVALHVGVVAWTLS